MSGEKSKLAILIIVIDEQGYILVHGLGGFSDDLYLLVGGQGSLLDEG